MRYAIYDIGSNSVKFLVVEEGTTFRVIVEKSKTTRLAEDLIATCELKAEAIERTLRVLSELRAEADQLGVTLSRAVATSAVRDSKNRKQFLKAASEILGTPILLLSGEEEAEAVYRGICSDPVFEKEEGQKELIGLDVGGGSSEWVLGKGGIVRRRMSLPLGCVRLRERFIPSYPLSPEALTTFTWVMEEQLTPALAPFIADVAEKRGRAALQIIGTGGAITAAAALDLGLTAFEAGAIHRYVLPLVRVEALIARLAALDLTALQALPGLPPKRGDIVMPGLVVFAVTLRLLGLDQITVSIRGLRYGVLDHLREEVRSCSIR